MEKLSGPVSGFLEKRGMHPDLQDTELNAGLFLGEMRNGLNGVESSIKMLPGFLSLDFERKPEGRFAVIDAGGTNFRTCLVSFGAGAPRISELKTSQMPGSAGKHVSWDEFIAYTATAILPLLKKTRKAAFCFSYPTVMYPDGDGSLVTPTKQIQISGFEGRKILADLSAKLKALGKQNVELTLLNDTLSVLLSSFANTRPKNPADNMGLIVGTGLNTAAFFNSSIIEKLRGAGNGEILINLESGGFSKLRQGDFDLELDRMSRDPGNYKYEKMCSGAYLGTLSEITLHAAAEEGIFSPGFAGELEALTPLDSAAADAIAVGKLTFSKIEDAKKAAEIVRALIERAARLVTANLFAIALLRKNHEPSRKYVISADGSVFRKCAIFRDHLITNSRYIFESRLSSGISFVSPENGTAIGAALSAALRKNY